MLPRVSRPLPVTRAHRNSTPSGSGVASKTASNHTVSSLNSSGGKSAKISPKKIWLCGIDNIGYWIIHKGRAWEYIPGPTSFPVNVLNLWPFPLLFLASPVAMSGAAESGPRISFNRDVRPVLSDACFHCHGPDEKERKGGLRLDLAEEASKPAKSGEIAIVPGNPSKSELLARINTEDRDDLMPPAKGHKALTVKQKDLLRQWIEQGAVYEKHWAFVPLTSVPLPSLKRQGWARNGLDHFVLERLEREGLAPSPEASKEALIRRVSLDLTGLPPTPAEVDAFLADATPQAFEKVVDRLLASPRFGERMAVDWLDAARYADTNGYQTDEDRQMWPWREWVISAFNRNLPFDQFTIEQLAGDLLPSPTLEQRIATGLHRNHMINAEGGAIPEEFIAEYTADRVETTASVWLGQTFNCTRCHDHKYDPFTQKDFYSLKAFFNNIPEKGVDGRDAVLKNSLPVLKLPNPQIEKRIADLETAKTDLEKQIAESRKAAGDGLDAWAQGLGGKRVAWAPLELIEASGNDLHPLIKPADTAVEVADQDSRYTTLKLRARLPDQSVTALRFECAAQASGPMSQWPDLKVFRAAAPGSKREPLKLRSAAEGSSLASAESAKLIDTDRTSRVDLSGKPEAPTAAVFEVELGAPGAREIEIEISTEGSGGAARWRVFAAQAGRDALVSDAVTAVAAKDPAKRSPKERQQLLDFRLSLQDDFRKLDGELSATKTRIATEDGKFATTMVMEEMTKTRPTFVLMRGAYDKPGEPVTAATPAILPAMAPDAPKNRLGLARWLVDPANPLPSRVTVNRFWQSVFGTGLVRTSEDFGAQGELPSHPELLDWLAGEFIRSGWDVKSFIRLLVTSATYRQSSKLSPQLNERDPENRLLARGPRVRLQAEFVRDQALFAAGLLVEKVGGASVKPYHPPGLYEQVTMDGVYRQGTGADLYRRSLYTYWKRSVPNPAMLLFDAPLRESCTMRRPRSNTPLQALNLMNDPTYVEASRCVAERMLKEGGDAVETRITHGFRLLLGRVPQPAELVILRRAYERNLRVFESDPAAANALTAIGSRKAPATLPVPELAAYSVVASTILNFDEWIKKE